MGKNKGKQFNIEKRAMLSRMVAKGGTAKEIGKAFGLRGGVNLTLQTQLGHERGMGTVAVVDEGESWCDMTAEEFQGGLLRWPPIYSSSS